VRWSTRRGCRGAWLSSDCRSLVVEKLLDRGAQDYLYLHNPRQGEPSAQTQVTRSQDRLPCEASALSTPTPRPSKTRSSPAATSSTAATSCRFATNGYGVCAPTGRTHRRDRQRASACPGPPTTKLSAEFARRRGHLVCLCAQEARPRVATNYVAEARSRPLRAAAHAGTPPWMRLARGTREAAISGRDPRADDFDRAPTPGARSLTSVFF